MKTVRDKSTRKPFKRKRLKGDLMAGALSVAIIVASTIIVVNTLTPLIDESKASQNFNVAKDALTRIDSMIGSVMIEAPGSRRSMNVNLQDGKMIVSGKEDRIKVRIENVNLLESGITTEENGILVTGGAKIKSYESDIDSDGDTDLVLENAAVIFSMDKIGTQSSHAAINTTTFITQIKNARTGMNITPTSGIFVNDQANTSYGTGYTEISATGDSYTRSIRAYVNSSSGIQYEALFTLQAAKDFVELQVKRIV